MSSFPTGAAGLANIQQMMLDYLGQTGTPQTGDGGIVNTQVLLEQVLAGGGGGSSMEPPGSTGIVNFTTNSSSGASSYNKSTGALNIPNYLALPPANSTGITALTTNGGSQPATYSAGALNIPVYASSILNMQKAVVTTQYSTTSNVGIATGVGFPFVTQVNPFIWFDYSILVTITSGVTPPGVAVVQSPGSVVPPGGSVPSGSWSTIGLTRMDGTTVATTTLNGSFLYNAAIGTPYVYYLLIYVGGGSGTVTINANSATGLCAFEVK